jgi:hypothetical protein
MLNALPCQPAAARRHAIRPHATGVTVVRDPRHGHAIRVTAIRSASWPCYPSKGHAIRVTAMRSASRPFDPRHGHAIRITAMRSESRPCDPHHGHAIRVTTMRSASRPCDPRHDRVTTARSLARAPIAARAANQLSSTNGPENTGRFGQSCPENTGRFGQSCPENTGRFGIFRVSSDLYHRREGAADDPLARTTEGAADDPLARANADVETHYHGTMAACSARLRDQGAKRQAQPAASDHGP